MEKEKVIVQISAETYWGFRCVFEKKYYNSQLEVEIVKQVKTQMKAFFHKHNLMILKEGVDKLNLHFHNTIESDDGIVYLCDHTHTT